MAVINRTVVISSVIVAIISIARLLVVSNYQTPTAIALADSSGAVSTLTGTLVPLVPVFLPFATQLLALCTFVAVVSGSELRLRLFLATTIAFMATVLVAPAKRSIQDLSHQYFEVARTVAIWVLVLLFLLSVVVIFIEPRAQMITFITGSTFIIMLVVITVAVPTLVAYSFPLPSEMWHIPEILHRVWLPTERVGMKDGLQRVGYVLKMDGNWATILWDSDRSIGMVKTVDVMSRTICRIGPPDGLPLISLQAAEIPRIEPCEFSDTGLVLIAPLRVLHP
jgi:hypothetical protein